MTLKPISEKIEIEKVTVEKLEGKREDLGKRTFWGIDGAERHICSIAHTAPAQGNGYDKTEIVIRFADGFKYIMRLDLISDMAADYGTIRKQMKDYLKYAQTSRLLNHAQQHNAGQILETYAI